MHRREDRQRNAVTHGRAGTAYTVEDATYEEMVQSHAEDAKRNTEAWDRLYEGMTDEEKMGDMLKGNI